MRATAPGLLTDLPGSPRPPAEARESPGSFSVVVDESGGRTRNLPSLYVNNTQLYAHRDVGVMIDRLHEAVDAFVRAPERPAYMLTACEIDGRRGLFATDFYNRSPYRHKLRRLGMTFSDHPFVFFDGASQFVAADTEPFRPSFVALGGESDRPPGVVRTSGARFLQLFTFYRVADIGAAELSALARLLPTVEGLSATEPEDLVDALRPATA